MKINNTVIKLMIVSFMALFLSGCLNDLFDEKDLTFQGESQLEWRPRNEVTVDTTGAPLLELETGDDNETLRAQLIGPQRDSDLSVSFIIGGESTAVEGTHFNLLTSSPVTLPANSSSTASIEIELIDDSVPAGETRTLILELQDSEGVPAAENLKTYTLVIEGL